MPPRPSVTGRELYGAGRVTLAEALASAEHPGGCCQLRAVLCSDCVFLILKASLKTSPTGGWGSSLGEGAF